jgi:hypothetical protein
LDCNTKISDKSFPFPDQNNQLVKLSIQKQPTEEYNRSAVTKDVILMNPVKLIVKASIPLSSNGSLPKNTKVCISENENNHWSSEDCSETNTTE